MKAANSLIDFWSKTWEVAHSDRVSLRLFGGEATSAVVHHFSRPHRLIPFLQNKEFGAALYRFPDASDSYLAGGCFELARRKIKKAKRCGLSVHKVKATDYFDDILHVNGSSPSRQGRPVNCDYLERDAVGRFCDEAGVLYGVLDDANRLKAYAHVPVLGDVCLFSRLLGHADELDNGIMYLLITEAIKDMFQVRMVQGFPNWAMYDMFWGAKRGLRDFKRRLGFKPFRVHWIASANHE